MFRRSGLVPLLMIPLLLQGVRPSRALASLRGTLQSQTYRPCSSSSSWLGRAGRMARKAAQEDLVEQSSASAATADAGAMKSPFLQTLIGRGFFHQCSDLEGLDKRLSQGEPAHAYLGFDATADSLHVGSLLQIMVLRHLQQCGHKPIVLVGGGTTKVGDPSGKDESRQMLNEESIAKNIEGISSVFRKFLVFGEGPTDAILVNNDEWLSSLGYIDFLRIYGPQFTINRMLSFESVRLRLEREQPLTFLEFNYMLLQAYDFLELYRRYKCCLQLGGSDQWGNMINGVDLGRRMEGAELYALTAPLVTTSDGKKMGKTASGAVWLNADKLSAYDYWQFWRNTVDADVGRFLRLFTELPLDEIAKLEALEGKDINEAKKVLADEATCMLHGSECLPSIHETALKLFEGGSGSAGSLPRFSVTAAEAFQGIPIVDMFLKAELGSSKGEVRRLIKGGGARLNDAKVQDEGQIVLGSDYVDGEVKLSAGKKKHAIIEQV